MTDMTNQDETVSQNTKTGRLPNIRIGKRVAIMVFLGLAGLAALSLIYLAADSDIETETAHADDYTHMAPLAGKVDANALQMRRREKDFILRNDMKYAEAYHMAADTVLAALTEMRTLSAAAAQNAVIEEVHVKIGEHAALLEEALISQADKVGISLLLDQYVKDFNAYAAGYAQEREMRKQLSA